MDKAATHVPARKGRAFLCPKPRLIAPDAAKLGGLLDLFEADAPRQKPVQGGMAGGMLEFLDDVTEAAMKLAAIGNPEASQGQDKICGRRIQFAFADRFALDGWDHILGLRFGIRTKIRHIKVEGFPPEVGVVGKAAFA